MKKSDIKKSRNIAVFMNAATEYIGGEYAYKVFPHTPFLFPEALIFNASFDWIIPAIKAFRNLDMQHHEYKAWVQAIDDAVTDDYNIGQVFYELAAAIAWYNAYKKTIKKV